MEKKYYKIYDLLNKEIIKRSVSDDGIIFAISGGQAINTISGIEERLSKDMDFLILESPEISGQRLKKIAKKVKKILEEKLGISIKYIMRIDALNNIDKNVYYFVNKYAYKFNFKYDGEDYEIDISSDLDNSFSKEFLVESTVEGVEVLRVPDEYFINSKYFLALKWYAKEHFYTRQGFRVFFDINRIYNTDPKINKDLLAELETRFINIELNRMSGFKIEHTLFDQLISWFDVKINEDIDGTFLKTNIDKVIHLIKNEYSTKISKEEILESLSWAHSLYK